MLDSQPAKAESRRQWLLYTGLLGGVALLYLWIRAFGDTLVAPPPLGVSRGGLPAVHVNDFLHVLVALALVISAARALGAIFRLVHQPPVVGEMIAGILLGPSVLGHFAPAVSAYILPQSIAPLLNVISQVGIILYMFLVGLDVDLSALRQKAHATVLISHASIVVPFLLGAGLALLLYPTLSDSGVSFTAFSLFLGVSMSVTAFPVLARILSDRGIQRTRMGVLTLACAAIDDVTAWCLLAFVVSVTHSRAGHALPTVLLAIGYIALMLVVLRPLLARLSHYIDGKGRISQGMLAFVLLAILVSSLTTETIGIHSIFGAFVLGAMIPSNGSLARDLTAKLEDFVIVFLLPAFFAYTGLRTQISLVSGTRDWLFCLLIIAVASVGKFGGSAAAARLTGLGWRDASAIGVLMNTRGLMELIVLNIGLELHVISPTLFAMLVIMAIATTVATTPILHFITPQRILDKEADAINDAQELALQASERTGTLIPVSSANGIGNLLDIALSLTPEAATPPRVLALTGRSVEGVRGGLPETERVSPSRSAVLAAAIDAAWSRGTVIVPEIMSTGEPANSIVNAIKKSHVRWLILESRRSILGRYPKRSLVSQVMAETARLPVNVAVLLQSSSLRERPIICLIGEAVDGTSAVELAFNLSRRGGEKVRIVQVLDESTRGALAERPAWLSNQKASFEWQQLVITRQKDLVERVPQGLAIVAQDVAERWSLDLEDFANGRSVIMVQGAGARVLHAAPEESDVGQVAASAVS